MAKASKKGFPKAVIIIIIVALVLLGGYFFFLNNPVIQKGLDVSTGGKFSSIKDALTKSVSLECEYMDPQGAKAKVWIKNGAIRSDMPAVGSQEAGSMIMKDKKMYIWNGTEGIVMTIPDKVDSDDTAKNDSDNQADNLIKDLEAYKDQCKPSVVSDSLFTPPTNVKFNDMSEMMKGIPTKTGTTSEEDVKKMMEKYNPSETPGDN